MHKFLIALFVFGVFLRINCQTGTQLGLSTLPVFDYLNTYPQNTIRGAAFSGNFGCYFTKNLAFGVNPFLAVANNNFSSPSFSSDNELLMYGLNTYLRYYFVNGERYRLYSICAAGLSHMMTSTTYPGRPTWGEEIFTDGAIALMGGVGANYYITGNFAIELNVTYINLMNVFVSPPETYFHTVAPTFGFQFHFNGSAAK